MQFLNFMYVILLWFEFKVLIQLKTSSITQKSLQNLAFRKSGSLFREIKIPKSFGKTTFEKWIFINKPLKDLLPSVFSSWFKFLSESQSHDNRWQKRCHLQILFY